MFDSEFEYEETKDQLKVIDEMGFNDYFLIVWDYVRFAKENGILVGPAIERIEKSDLEELVITNTVPLTKEKQIEEMANFIYVNSRKGINANFDALVNLIENAIDEDAPITVKEGGIFKKGYNKELDELLSISSIVSVIVIDSNVEYSNDPSDIIFVLSGMVYVV